MINNLSKDSCYNYMNKALNLAKLSGKDIPVGALIICNNEIIGCGYNQRENQNDATAHAEIVAIRQACEYMQSWRLTNSVIFSTLEPCPMCTEAIIQARIGKIYFGAYDYTLEVLNLTKNLFNSRRGYPIPEVIGGILEEECSQLLLEYFKNEVRV